MTDAMLIQPFDLPNAILSVLAVAAIFVTAVMLIEIVYLLAVVLLLGLGTTARLPRGRAARVAAITVVSGLLTAAAPASAQQGRVLEPRFTRLFSADSINIVGYTPASLSPDGRWVVFSTSTSIWVVSRQSGEAIRLTQGQHMDLEPTWTPSGDRILFRSSRLSPDGGMPIVSLPFDAETGRAAGPLRRVTLESGMNPAVSPDGQWVAFIRIGRPPFELMVVPVNGGNARSLATLEGPFGAPIAWSADGQYVYVPDRAPASDNRSILRVPVDGASAIERLSVASVAAIGARHVASSRGRDGMVRISIIGGAEVGRFEPHRNMRIASFTPDGRGLLGVVSETAAPIRVVPVAGGPARQLTEARNYDWPLGWSADGTQLYIATRTNGREAVLSVPVDGGPAKEFLFPAETGPCAATGVRSPGVMSPGVVVSPDGRYMWLCKGTPERDRKILVTYRVADGRTREITQALHLGSGLHAPTGPGATNDVLYVEQHANRIELWRSPPEGPATLLQAFPLSLLGQTGFAVYGDRIAYMQPSGDSMSLYLAEGRDGPARKLATTAGGLTAPVWSPDGRWIAADWNGPEERHAVHLFGVTPEGRLAAEPRVVPSGASFGWGIQWLPDGRAVTVFGMTDGPAEVWLVPLFGGEAPVAITRDDPAQKWGYSLSPDGRWVAYPSEVPRGSSIWLVDLGDALVSGQR